jgi:O-antigen ligase
VIASLSPKAAGLGLGALSVSRFDTLLGLLRWLSYAAFLIAALEGVRRPRGAQVVLGVVAGLGIFEAIYGVANLLSGNTWLLWLPRETGFSTATGTLVNRNHYAAVLEICLPAFLARRWLTRRAQDGGEDRAITATLIILATVMGLAAVLSGSRAGVLCMAAGLGGLMLMAPPDREGRGGRLAVAALGVMIMLYGGFAGGQELTVRFKETSADVSGIRPALWRDGLSMLAEFPIIGSGVGTFESVFPGYRRFATQQAAYAHAHFDCLEVATEGGLVAMVLVVWAMISFARRIGGGLRRAAGRRRLALAAVIAGIVSPLLHGMVDFPLHIPGIAFLVLAMAGVALGLADQPPPAAGYGRYDLT